MDTAAIQRALSARGYALDTPTGYAGAVRAFQAAAGLDVDGVPGRLTQLALGKPAAAVPFAGMASLVTIVRLRKFEPFGRADILAAIAAALPEIEAAGITTPLRWQHFIAQVAHESAGLARTEEVLSYSAARLCEVWPHRFPSIASATPFARNPEALAEKVYGGRMGNTRPGDGWRYRGSGGLGTTGGDNFRAAGAGDDPDRLRTPAGFLGPALLYWRTRGCSALADRDDVDGVTLKINGGTIGLTDRRLRLAGAKRAFAA